MEPIRVNIDGKDMVFKLDLRAFMVYESLAGRPFNGGLTLEVVSLMYSALAAHNDMEGMTFDKFVDYLDGAPACVASMARYMTEYYKGRHEGKDRGERR